MSWNLLKKLCPEISLLPAGSPVFIFSEYLCKQCIRSCFGVDALHVYKLRLCIFAYTGPTCISSFFFQLSITFHSLVNILCMALHSTAVHNTLCLKKTSPFLFLWYLCQISSDSVNFWQKHAPGNLKQRHVHAQFISRFICSYCTL